MSVCEIIIVHNLVQCFIFGLGGCLLLKSDGFESQSFFSSLLCCFISVFCIGLSTLFVAFSKYTQCACKYFSSMMHFCMYTEIFDPEKWRRKSTLNVHTNIICPQSRKRNIMRMSGKHPLK